MAWGALIISSTAKTLNTDPRLASSIDDSINASIWLYLFASYSEVVLASSLNLLESLLYFLAFSIQLAGVTVAGKTDNSLVGNFEKVVSLIAEGTDHRDCRWEKALFFVFLPVEPAIVINVPAWKQSCLHKHAIALEALLSEIKVLVTSLQHNNIHFGNLHPVESKKVSRFEFFCVARLRYLVLERCSSCHRPEHTCIHPRVARDLSNFVLYS